MATPELFKILGVDPLSGRTFLPDDDGKPPVAVLSYGLWQRRFGGQASVIGQPITLSGIKFTVIGVMPANFQFHIKQRSGTGPRSFGPSCRCRRQGATSAVVFFPSSAS